MSMIEGYVDEENMSHLSIQENDCVPPQLKEVNELLKSINVQLEDCALEWQAKISQQQWEIFSARNVTQGPWEQSVLARTFFAEKVLDEKFQNLLSCSKSFLEQFNNFIVLLQNKQPNLSIQEEQKSLKYCSDISESQSSVHNPVVEPLDLSLLNYMNSNTTKKKGKQFHTRLLGINSSFADVIKAKITFDTKFLGFEAILHKMSTTSPSEDALSNFCKIYANGSITEKRKAAEVTLGNKQKKRQTRITKGKQITGFRRGAIRKCRKKGSVSLGDGDQLSTINKSNKEIISP
ncbi:hypothetical protein KPH14_003257 [Odynerus spinipes]|uniref:Uncharacterized protein n=1 Tax=Odynerus spinipes TaxID=1348599 RepID=A0AAD9VMP1_9HYME|nr:hypothetical protein KPH14_003257 [Odynerus spinipes]